MLTELGFRFEEMALRAFRRPDWLREAALTEQLFAKLGQESPSSEFLYE
jgi:hypothetical protein